MTALCGRMRNEIGVAMVSRLRLHLPLLFLLLLTGIQGLLWSILNPPLLAPDEPQHFLYAQDMAARPAFRLAPTDKASGEVLQLAKMNDFHKVIREGYLPPLDEVRAKTFQRRLESLARSPGQRFRDSDIMSHPNFRQYHPPLYHGVSAPLQRLFTSSAITLRFQLQRIVTVLMAVGTVAVTYWLGLGLWDSRRAPALAAATMVAFHPVFTFQSGVISDQILEMLLFNALLLVSVGLLKKWWSSSAILVLGVLAGLGSLSRVSFVVCVVPLIVTFVLLRKRDWRWAAAFVIALLMTAGWYFPLLSGQAHDVVMSYKVTSAKPGMTISRPGPVTYVSHFEWIRWPRVLDDYWGESMGFGAWPNTDPGTPDPIRWLLGLLFGAALLLALKRIRDSGKVVWLLWSAIPAYPLFFQALDYYFTWYVTGPGLDKPHISGFFWFRGQYFLPLVPAQMLLSCEGIRRAMNGAWLIFPAGLLAGTSLYNLFFILVPRYYPGTLWEAFDRAHSWSFFPPALSMSLAIVLVLGVCFWLGSLFRLLRQPQSSTAQPSLAD